MCDADYLNMYELKMLYSDLRLNVVFSIAEIVPSVWSYFRVFLFHVLSTSFNLLKIFILRD